MKIGILYICVGRYSCFWQGFHDSCEKNLLPGVEKNYYVFTNKEMPETERVSYFYQDDMGWPCNSLFRFKMFNRIKDQICSNDYLFFFNANAEIVKTVNPSDILPESEDYSAMCISTNPEAMGHETRSESVVCVPPGTTSFYFSGALNGGKSTAFIQLIEKCNKLVDTDLNNGIMPVWHDESVLNKFLVDKSVKVMYRDMGKPANWSSPKGAKIVLRRKEDVLGRNWLRNYKGREHTNTWLRKLLRFLGFIK